MQPPHYLTPSEQKNLLQQRGILFSNNEAKDIQKTIRRFYAEFIPSSKYKIKELPELEYYHDDITEFLIPIED